MSIESFDKKGPYFVFSSMYPLENGVETLDGEIVNCVEIGYMSEKFEDPIIRAKILAVPNGYAAKSMARTIHQKEGVPLRPDWEEAKVNVMRWYVYQKVVRNPEVAEALLATGDQQIFEGNRRDRFWGVAPVGSHNGQNWLGRIWMETRDWLRDPNAPYVEHPAPQFEPVQ